MNGGVTRFCLLQQQRENSECIWRVTHHLSALLLFVRILQLSVHYPAGQNSQNKNSNICEMVQFISDWDSVPPLTCTWAPRCVAVCPSSRLHCRRAAAAAGRSRRWSTCSWTEEAPPPGSSPAPPPKRTRATLQCVFKLPSHFSIQSFKPSGSDWVLLLKIELHVWIFLKVNIKNFHDPVLKLNDNISFTFRPCDIFSCSVVCGFLTFRVRERWGDGAHSTSSWTSERGVPAKETRTWTSVKLKSTDESRLRPLI